MREADSVVRARHCGEAPRERSAAHALRAARAYGPPLQARPRPPSRRRHTASALPHASLPRPRRCTQIKRMDMEARSLPAERARPLTAKVKEYKADLASLREQLKQAAATAGASDAARAELVRRRGLWRCRCLERAARAKQQEQPPGRLCCVRQGACCPRLCRRQASRA